MELLNPTLTIQNTDQPWWLVRMQHRVSDCESIDITLKVPRTAGPVHALQAQLMKQAADLLLHMAGENTGTPGAG